jgi:hypothetical protein
MFNTVDPSELEKYICTNEFDILMSWFDFGLWCLMPLLTIFQLYIQAVSFIDGGKRNTWRKQTWS